MNKELPFTTEKEMLLYLAENALFSLHHSCCYGQHETSITIEDEGLEKVVENQYPGFLAKLDDFIVYRCIHPKSWGGHTEFFVKIKLEDGQISIVIGSSIYGPCINEFEPEGRDELSTLIKPVLGKINKIIGFEHINENNFDTCISFTSSNGELSCEINMAGEDEFDDWKDYEEVEGAEDVVSVLENFFNNKIRLQYVYSEEVSVRNNVVLFYPESQMDGEEVKFLYTIDELCDHLEI